MLASVQWLNQYLKGGSGPVSADEADHVLTNVAFPIEARVDLPGGDVQLDVELTSNRGDCLCHLGLAREIAAATRRDLVPPALVHPDCLGEGPGEVGKITSVENRCVGSGGCPRFTARVIRGVKVGPSPKWMVRALESVGQRSINNIVDVSNFVLHELGHPCHTFDLETLEGRRIIVRSASAGERLTVLDGEQHELRADELVVADEKRVVSLAGVIGGLDTSVTDTTTEVLLEMATWDPVAIRRVARRLDIRTDASHRFERYVDPREIDFAALRAAELIVEVAGGEIVPGLLDEGADLAQSTAVEMRMARCEHLLGIAVPVKDAARLLEAIGISVKVKGSGKSAVLHCTIPANRPDLTREADLIEEVVRLHGFDQLGIRPSMDVHLELDHPARWTLRERAINEVGRVLSGMGFFETVTLSFASQEEAEPFAPEGLRLLKVDEERRKGAPFLRPSIVPSLLACRKASQDGGVQLEGGIRLYECASVYAEMDDGDAFGRQTIETRNLALLVDAPGPGGMQDAIRLVRGAIEGVARALGGDSIGIEVESADKQFMPAVSGETLASISLDGSRIGYVSTFASSGAIRAWDLSESVVGCEVNLDSLIALYPPRVTVRELPKFPPIRRDLSVVVGEDVEWEQIARVVGQASLPLMVGLQFVGVYRGKQIEAGRKSITLRLEFRDPKRTLRHDEVDPQMETLVGALDQTLGAVVRGPIGAA